jgi:hypothetical protein
MDPMIDNPVLQHAVIDVPAKDRVVGQKSLDQKNGTRAGTGMARSSIREIADKPSTWIVNTSALERKPLARQMLRVLAGRGVRFDRVLFRPLHPRCKTGLPGDAPYLECSQSCLVVHYYFQWNIDSNSNNGPSA